MLLEELFSCEAVVIPGGGLLQSATSLASLFYYLSLLTLARLAGARIFLPAQGFGPLRHKGRVAGLVNRWLAAELEQANYLSVRDAGSLELVVNITTLSEVPLTADLAFLSENWQKPEKDNSLPRVYAILRGSVAGADRIAEELVCMHKDFENFDLQPAALQPGEDDKLWYRAGWAGNVCYSADPADCLARSDVVISMRLHGCILATLSGIPWAAVAYDPKVSAFADSCRWKFCASPEKVDRTWLEGVINQLLARKDEYGDRLNRCHGEKRRLAEDDYQRFKQIFAG
jgi:polysaccharide pyruvyl transferase WcaK-like protein